ncbi:MULTISPECIES: GntR family transcriptional regulator [Sphingobium]|uniref:GntR-family transcriptional regulator n=1 Tax=Sphingobium indicum (strain DSM 16413 / CCM 7287 / MTCC 6362 / UT26 / NBRC 101211 / UT26S) TaxID=452662 RepID=D4Z8W7_SPHIU|nr:GntR family transcriptional regulator [Sphingobium indicum]BAI99049.1 GntR-family transcriptional regulator [Sphingobium indicum UT26S]
MSPEPVAAERTYRLLRERIIIGAIKPGWPLNLQRLAEEFNVSVSPLRDAMHRLVGERIIEALPVGGFQLPIPSKESLHDLYSWHDKLIRQAVTRRLTAEERGILPALSPDLDPEILARAVTTLFAVLGGASGNAEHIEAIANASARLFRVRLAEIDLIKGVLSELESLVTVSATGDAVSIRHAVWGYHRRRLRRSAKLVAEMMAR